MTTSGIILTQIQAIDNMTMWAWGADKLVGGKATKEHNGFLEFNVRNCFNVEKAKVRITLEYNDTYTIKVYNTRKVRGKLEYKETIIAEEKDVHVETLVDIIDLILG